MERGLVTQVIIEDDTDVTWQVYLIRVTLTGAVAFGPLVQDGPRFEPVNVTSVPPRIVPFEGLIESMVGVVEIEKVMRASVSVTLSLASSEKPSNGCEPPPNQVGLSTSM